MKDEIFCCKCKFFNPGYDEDKCWAPENCKVKKTYCKEYLVPKKSPKKLNKNNDCLYFQPKDTK